MRAIIRLLTLSTLLAVLGGMLLTNQVDAAPFQPRPYSESSRLEAKTDCQLGGGTSFETVYHYEFGSKAPTSATTTCHGGTNDGQTCRITGSQKICGAAAMPTRDPSGGVVVEQIAS